MDFNFPDFDKILKTNKYGFRNSSIFSISQVIERSERIQKRFIDTTPYKILDSPGLIDDYYLNVLDWTSNRVTIGLNNTLYTYNVDTKEANEIYICDENVYITSVLGSGDNIYVGESTGVLRKYNLEYETWELFQQHNTRVCSLAINRNGILSTGSKNGKIVNIDERVGSVFEFVGHNEEVCSLRWNGDTLASGSNDNTVRIWKIGSPLSHILEGHCSAVKGMDWCPWKSNLLCTGGGTNDKSIKLWDTSVGKCVKTTMVKSQVSFVKHLTRYKELVSAHGYEQNDLRLWKVAGMKLISSFGKHDSRILHCVVSPDECSIASLGADESLKFWKITNKIEKTIKRDSIGLR